MASGTSISAVLDEELARFLGDIGELDRVERGDANCTICLDVISLNNIQLVVPDTDKVLYVCQKESCMLKFALESGNQ